MAQYEILIKPSAVKELKAIKTKKDRQRLTRRIQSLAKEPRPSGCKKLSGLNLFRIRQGSFRIVYEIQDKKLIVTVIKIGDRKEIYRAR